MIKEAIEFVTGLATKSEVIQKFEHAGQSYTNRELHRLPQEPPVPSPDVIGVSSLRSLAAYVSVDPDVMEDGHFATVVSPTEVAICTSVMGEAQTRKTYARAKALLPKIQIGTWMSVEELGIHLRTCFVQTVERDALVAFLGGIIDTSEVRTADDGVSQQVTVRTGLSLVKEGEVPSPVALQPFRTFHDVEQPMGSFILRMDKGKDGPIAALFDADGGAWRHEATQSVAEYLRENTDLHVFA